MHHFTQIGSAASTKEPKIAALTGFGRLASVVRFKDADAVFGCIESRDAPSLKILDEFTDAVSLEALVRDNKTQKSFSNFVMLPPYLASTFLAASSRKPSDLACTAAVAEKTLK